MFYFCKDYKNITRHQKILQSRFFVCFRDFKVSSWNIKSFLSLWKESFISRNIRNVLLFEFWKLLSGIYGAFKVSISWNKINFFGVCVSWSIKNFLRVDFFHFSGLGWKGFHFWKYKKCLLLRKYKDFFNIRARKVYFFFSRWFFLKYFLGLGW